MPEADTTLPGEPLPDVTTSQDREYQEWAESLNVSVDELRVAVETVGHSADAVRDHFSARKA